ncbi:Eukaryotic aspartyl protease family protein [Euphorbia peplus]|nr:Eukaryotic aspartyl protease family protein [Euphorbia peplus]
MPHFQCFLASFAPFILIIFLSFLSFGTPKPLKNGFKFQLIHRDSPQSPFYEEYLTHSQRIERIAESSNMRAKSFQLDVANPQKLDVAPNFVSYLVKLSFGTPSIQLYLILDTGSHLTWTQCEPCIRKYHQEPPVFNSTMSHTFRELPCQHPFCRDNNSIFRCERGKCVYRLQYILGDVTEGVAASDVFQPLGNTEIPLNFGCSKNSRAFTYLEHTGRSGGIMGLSMSPVSLVQQLGNVTKHRFSYCLVPYDQLHLTPSSSLRFGNEISTRGRTFKSIPIITPGPYIYLYYLDLQDISIDHNRLNYPPHTFALQHDHSGGCAIDSGTTLTHIAGLAYPRLKAALLNHFRNKRFTQVHVLNYDLCYNTGRRMDELPTMTFHFRGADLEIEKRNMIIDYDDTTFCLAIQESTVTLIGAIQQGDTRFIFDLASRQLRFSPENCLLDR